VFREACPDRRSEPHFMVSEGDLVVECFSARGTQHGTLLGVEPTGATIVLEGINIFRIDRLDEVGLLRQLGLVSR
jgi:predicted ester cyclase